MASVTPPASSSRRKRCRPSISSSHWTASVSISRPRHEPSWQPGKDTEKRAISQGTGLGSLGGLDNRDVEATECARSFLWCARSSSGGFQPVNIQLGEGGKAGKNAQARRTLQ